VGDFRRKQYGGQNDRRKAETASASNLTSPTASLWECNSNVMRSFLKRDVTTSIEDQPCQRKKKTPMTRVLLEA
jgi:hypothetical protein